MIGPISVPTNQKPAIQELAKLTEDAYEALRQCLTEGRAYSEPDVLLESTSKAVETHTRLGGQILGSVVGLRSLIDRASMSPAEVAAGVASDAQAKGYVSADLADVLVRRLTELLETRTVAVSSKAFSLVIADASPFSDVRIVSDVRPIFAAKGDGMDFEGSVIVHHLHIEVGGEGENQHSALTTNDLVKLKRTVERALDKDKKLREVLRNGPLSPLETSIRTDKES